MKYERIHRGFLESDIGSIRKFVLNLQIELHEKMQKQDIYIYIVIFVVFLLKVMIPVVLVKIMSQ